MNLNNNLDDSDLKELKLDDFCFECGIDEAGRGPLAGPVTASAVILPKNFPVELLNDSKKLTEKKRLIATSEILQKAIWSVGWASNFEIDSINILQASLLAMRRAWLGVKKKLETLDDFSITNYHIVVDGTFVPKIKDCDVRAEIKADGRFYSVMAASILAKTCRDKMMERYSWIYPEYGYEKHKGYPTKAHTLAVLAYGASPIQRKTFHLPKIKS